MNNLNKENFWNEMNSKYPKAMDKFCKWIDYYKKEVQWDWLFGNDGVKHQIKFHDIPFEMQYGIIARFCIEHGLWGEKREYEYGVYRTLIDKFFSELQGSLELETTVIITPECHE